MSPWIGMVAFVVAIAAAIALHEWGHYVTARRFGMRAEKYFIGFGPTLWSTRRGETEVGVKWLPLGGFVRIAGMSPTDERQPPVADLVLDPEAVAADRRRAAEEQDRPVEEVPAVPEVTYRRLGAEMAGRGVPRADRDAIVAETIRRCGADAAPAEVRATFGEVVRDLLPGGDAVGSLQHRVLAGDRGRFFHDRPAWQRAIVLSAGSAMHFVIAIVALFLTFLAFQSEPVPRVDQVLDGSPAAEAGLQPGDEIVAVAGQPVDEFAEAKELIEAREGEPIGVTVERDGSRRTLELVTALQLSGLAGDGALVAAGFQPADRIVAVDGGPVTTPASIVEAASGQDEVAVTVERYGETPQDVRQVELTVPADVLDDVAEQVTGLVGFVPATQRLGPLGALQATFVGEGSFTWMVVTTFQALGTVFGPEGLSQIPEQLAGAERDVTGGASLVGITYLAGQGAAIAGLMFLLGVFASLNVFVGIFNLLPLPPLDGGHLAVLAVERSVNAVRQARGEPADYRVDPRTITAIAIPVIVFIGLVALSFLVLDITNPLELPQ